MRIGIDARSFTVERYTGIPRYIYEIVQEWARKHPEHEYYLFSNEKIKVPEGLPDNWHVYDEPWIIDNSRLWLVFKQPKLLRKLKIDVFWGPNFVLPKRVGKIRYFVTIHDLAIFKFKGIAEFDDRLRMHLLVKPSCRMAQKVVTVSDATKRDVAEILKIKEEKIVTDYIGGLPGNFNTLSCDDSTVSDCLKFKEPFFAFVGTIEPRKNITTIVHAFEDYVANVNPDVKLVLAGGRGWKCDGIYEAIENSPVKDKIIMPGFVENNDKAYIYKNAKAFVFPSLYEGFGIPVLESFAYGLPVITANNSSLPEVAGDAALFIDEATDVTALSHKMKEVMEMSQEELDELKLKMEKQLSKFSWAKCAEELMNIISE